ncbi:response regulator transcription factor [Actinoplanes sp. NPDC049548]|uniref:helix-turn-helix transcriptional regulator n=1 Tax=Actinoplanes sp. NPDC049548 TaxID=3155152 RepID=UPI00343CE096
MTVGRLRVAVRTADPLHRAGLVALLHGARQFAVLGEDDGRPDVLVVATSSNTELGMLLSRAAREVDVPVVLVADDLSPDDLLSLVRFHVRSVVPRRVVSAGALLRCVTAVAVGGAVLPPDLLGGLLQEVDRLHRDLRGTAPAGASGLTERELEILRLVADGSDTGEIAERLGYSTRTVKNIMYGITQRLNLRNRTHAVAYAVRAGLI